MKKVLLMHDFQINGNGGIDKHCDALVNLFRNDSEIQVLPQRRYEYIYVRFLKKQIPNWSSIKKMIKESNCDIVHIHGFASFTVPIAILAAKMCNKKIVYTAHYHPMSTLDHPILAKFFFFICLRPLLRFVKVSVALNNEDEVFLKRYIKCVLKIPHWIRFNSLNVDCSKKNPNMILFVGRNAPNKGIDHILNLPMNKYEVHCVCNGLKVLRGDFVCYQNVSDQELSELYTRSSLVVIPSRYEAFSLVALEAFMHHTPVVMSDRVHIADYLDGCRGYAVFSYGDQNDFQRCIASTIGSDVDTEKIAQIFSEERITTLYRKVYM